MCLKKKKLLQIFALEGFVKAQLVESLHDTILSPSCTVWCTGVVESLVFSVYLYIYIYVCNQVYCIHVPGYDPLIFSFLSFIVFDWVGVLWPQLSKVLKLVCWAHCVFFPPVSLQ